MNRLLTILRAVAALIVAAVVAVLVFTVLGSLLMAAGIFIAVMVVAGGLYILFFGRTTVRRQGGYEVIDITAVDITPPRKTRDQ
ncbi:hypothetical protein [Azorhizobium]|jgi:threonine/homoserine/homoserine lactone efflux protein|uniref:Transmembrane protein n=1 Tax=Azorhizobium caulinodans (strain ATCC 43989 / DSM 5975 / JCM 20966 / LMG 6465 / NBRC 14845 / NCIMB 13405 / ORS 571) TaxID=438753 RepID=A8IEU4_AZOC5|nr:hypothetical protein [Azorhizobium]TDU01134.1 hypothetical protein DFO45_0650 [Azorhizobium sp. AG788]BAF89534.1 conserved hypothetical protein [Azorhizobium caulinodans ORS 571]